MKVHDFSYAEFDFSSKMQLLLSNSLKQKLLKEQILIWENENYGDWQFRKIKLILIDNPEKLKFVQMITWRNDNYAK